MAGIAGKLCHLDAPDKVQTDDQRPEQQRDIEERRHQRELEDDASFAVAPRGCSTPSSGHRIHLGGAVPPGEGSTTSDDRTVSPIGPALCRIAARGTYW